MIIELLRDWHWNRKLKKIFNAISVSVIKLFAGDDCYGWQFQKSKSELYVSYSGCFLKVEIVKKYHVKWSIGIIDAGATSLYYRDCFNAIIIRRVLSHYPHPSCVGTSSDVDYYNDVQSAVDLYNKLMLLVDVFHAVREERDDAIVKLMSNQAEAEKVFSKTVDAYNFSEHCPQKASNVQRK